MSGSTPNEIIFSVEEAPEGGYTAHALGFSIITEADTWEELKDMVRDAARCASMKETRLRLSGCIWFVIK